jgi:hypothetical protein
MEIKSRPASSQGIGMHYQQAYRYIFASPNWTMNVLFATLAVFIPVAGQMVMMGYLFEVIEHFHNRHKTPGPETDHYPDFDTNKLMTYLMRGMAPFAAWFAFLFPVGLVSSCMWIIGNIIAAASGSTMVGLVVYLLLVVVIVVLTVIAKTLLLPVYLRAGFTGDFVSSFSTPVIKDFLSRVGRETALAQLVVVGSTIASLVTLCAFVVGFYAATAVVFMAAHYLDYELYELYLERGGAPIEIRPPTPAQT